MNALPILFSGPMVLGLLREAEHPGTGKTQTRRIVKPQPPRGPFQCHYSFSGWAHAAEGGGCSCVEIKCPYGREDDLLWVRESWREVLAVYGTGYDPGYRATCSGEHLYRWKPSIHMPRAASRLTLRITEVRIERLNSISEADAVAECRSLTRGDPRGYFPDTWEAINGPGSWSDNPWVWALTFGVTKANVDHVLKEAA